jgi:hypothetical protein
MMTPAQHMPLSVIANVAALIILAGTSGAAGQKPPQPSEFGKCLALSDSVLRLRCIDSETSALRKRTEPKVSMWRLLRTPNARGGPDVVSIMHTADTSRSDLDLAGLTLRCADNGVEVLVVVVEPRPPRSALRVELGAERDSAAFGASVVTPFSMILLPNDATALVTGPWRTRAELTIQIDGDGSSVRGVVPIAGLPEAMQSLEKTCAVR